MLTAIFNWFVGKPAPTVVAPPVQPEAAPYKVEAPPVVVAAAEPAPVVEMAKPEAKAKKPVAKKPAAKKPAAAPAAPVKTKTTRKTK
jgi:hypothetical protein